MGRHPGYEVLPSPEVKVYRDPEGRVEAVYLQVRSGKVLRKVQPDARYMVSFYLGAGDVLVGMRLLEPVKPSALALLFRRLAHVEPPSRRALLEATQPFGKAA